MTALRRVALTVPALLGLTLLAGPAPAAFREVTLCTDTTPVSQPGELRHTISTAARGDVILLPACRIVLTGAGNEDLNVQGDLDVVETLLDFQGSGADRSIVDGGGVDRVFHIIGSKVSMADLGIENGVAVVFDMFERGNGGGILMVTATSSTDVILERVALRRNRAAGFVGGALATGAAGLTMLDSTVEGNRTESDGHARGGGLSIFNSIGSMDGSTISGNTAAGARATGGGLFVQGSTFDVWQSTLSGNRVEGDSVAGGGVGVIDSTLVTVFQSTVTLNSADALVGSGAGVARIEFEDPSIIIVRGTILAGNDPDNCMGAAATSAGHNLDDGSTCSLGGPGDQSNLDPRLGLLADNGGPTRTHLPGPRSPALDRGPVAGCMGADQRGVTRPRDADGSGGALCDVGAVERRPARAERALREPRFLDPR